MDIHDDDEFFIESVHMQSSLLSVGKKASWIRVEWVRLESCNGTKELLSFLILALSNADKSADRI